MFKFIPPRLQNGNTVRVIAPSRGLDIVSDSVRNLACKRLTDLGLTVEFSQFSDVTGLQGVATVEQRLDDLHSAFADPGVHGILTVLGGFHANQLLPNIDFDLIKNHPKVFCGFSDITVLNNAITQQTGLVTYLGPHFSSFGMEQGLEGSLDSFQSMVMDDKPVTVQPSSKWSDDPWYLDQQQRTFYDNKGWLPISSGVAEGQIIGGNLSTFGLLRGTAHMPDFADTILFLEDDELSGASTLDQFGRELEALSQQPGFSGIKGLVIGRFQSASQVSEQKLRDMLAGCRGINGLPILADVDFGHTTPMMTLPIGGKARLEVGEKSQKLIISQG